MKTCIVFALCVAVATAAATGGEAKDAQILRSEAENIGVDGFRYAYETSNGIAAQEEGQLKNVGTENEAIQVRGQFSYTAPDGQIFSVTYTADENGFQPQGAHIPQLPQA